MSDKLDAYAPPSDEDEDEDENEDEDEDEEPESAPLASLWQRWAGKFLDGLISIAAGVLVGGLVMVATQTGNRRSMLISAAWGYAAGAILAEAVQWVLVARNGQSLGKMAMGTRIVRMDGSLPGFVHGVLLREWVLALPSWVFSALGWGLLMVPFGLLDLALIFRNDRRTLHDRIAGTSVIQV